MTVEELLFLLAVYLVFIPSFCIIGLALERWEDIEEEEVSA